MGQLWVTVQKSVVLIKSLRHSAAMNSSWSSFSSDSGPSPEDVERLERFQRAMAGPPDNVVPVAWPFTVMLARSEEAAVAVIGGQVFPNGCTFRVAAFLRSDNLLSLGGI